MPQLEAFSIDMHAAYYVNWTQRAQDAFNASADNALFLDSLTEEEQLAYLLDPSGLTARRAAFTATLYPSYTNDTNDTNDSSDLDTEY